MAVAALIKFVQGLSTPPVGEALIGDLAVLVTASNGDNANVAKWEWEWFATPTGSAILPGIIASGSVPSITFTPDVRGTYVLVERVYDLLGNVSQDMRCFSVLEASGRLIPNFGADQSALNFAGQRLGWHPYIEAFLKAVDAGGFGIAVQDEGVALGSFSAFNFVGNGVLATDAGGGLAQITIPVPTGTGLRHVTAGVEDGAAVLIADADVDPTAGIGGTKILPDFGAQAVTTTGRGSFAELVAAASAVDATSGGQVDDVATTGLSTLIYTDATPPAVSGFASGAQGRVLWVLPTGGALTLKHLAGSAAGNQISCPGGTDFTALVNVAIPLVYDGTSTVWRVVGASVGSGSPGGADKYVQFNDAAAFGGTTDFQFDKATKVATLFGLALTGSFISAVPLLGGPASPYGVHGGATVDMLDADYTAVAAEYANLVIENGPATPMTANRTLTLPNANDAATYFKFVRNTNGAGFDVLVQDVGAGTTARVPDGDGAWVGVHAAGAFSMSAMKSISLPVGFADLAIAATTIVLNFPAALPAGAIFQTVKCVTITPFQDAGNTTQIEVDLGFGATPDAFATNTTVLSSAGVRYGNGATDGTDKAPKLVRDVTPTASFFSFGAPVNLDTLTQGQAILTVFYTVA